MVSMSITTVIAIYFLIWWVTLFAVLPWGVRSQEEGGEVAPGTDPGAPMAHRVWRKLIWTTVVATLIFAVIVAAYEADMIPFEFLARISSPPHVSR